MLKKLEVFCIIGLYYLKYKLTPKFSYNTLKPYINSKLMFLHVL